MSDKHAAVVVTITKGESLGHFMEANLLYGASFNSKQGAPGSELLVCESSIVYKIESSPFQGHWHGWTSELSHSSSDVPHALGSTKWSVWAVIRHVFP